MDRFQTLLGLGCAACRFSGIYTIGRGGVTRSKPQASQRKAAELGHTNACLLFAARMYGDQPYARQVGHVVEAAGVAALAGVMEGNVLRMSGPAWCIGCGSGGFIPFGRRARWVP